MRYSELCISCITSQSKQIAGFYMLPFFCNLWIKMSIIQEDWRVGIRQMAAANPLFMVSNNLPLKHERRPRRDVPAKEHQPQKHGYLWSYHSTALPRTRTLWHLLALLALVAAGLCRTSCNQQTTLSIIKRMIHLFHSFTSFCYRRRWCF